MSTPAACGTGREMGLYVHVPFCRRKCRYCDFYSRPPREVELDRFVEAVVTEAGLRKNERPLSTLYFGGGTPSMLGADRLERMLTEFYQRFGVQDDAEITVEANPLDVTPEWAEGCVAAGFNRINIGVQSVDEDDLRFLGRLHHAPDGPAAIRVAREAGFGNIGIDLIYGLPGQTSAALRERLTTAVQECDPEHVSCYQLTYANDTPLGRDAATGKVQPLDHDREADLFMLVHELMAELGYEGYEVSNFAREERFRSRHNSNYWRHTNYIGLGPSAHSFRCPVRSWNVSSVSEYLASIESGKRPVAGEERLTQEQLASEMVMLTLRTTDGLDLSAYRDRFGTDLCEQKHDEIERLVGQGLVAVTDDGLRPTLKGLVVADSLAVELT